MLSTSDSSDSGGFKIHAICFNLFLDILFIDCYHCYYKLWNLVSYISIFIQSIPKKNFFRINFYRGIQVSLSIEKSCMLLVVMNVFWFDRVPCIKKLNVIFTPETKQIQFKVQQKSLDYEYLPLTFPLDAFYYAHIKRLDFRSLIWQETA